MEQKTSRVFINMNMLYDFKSLIFQIFDSVMEDRKVCNRDVIQKAQKSNLSFNNTEILLEQLNLNLPKNEKEEILKEINNCVSWASKSVKPKLYTLLKLTTFKSILNSINYKFNIVILKPQICQYVEGFNDDITNLSNIYFIT